MALILLGICCCLEFVQGSESLPVDRPEGYKSPDPRACVDDRVRNWIWTAWATRGPYQTSKPLSSDPGWHTNWTPTSRSHCTSPLGLTATWWKVRMTTCIDSLAQTVTTHSHWFLHRQTRRRDVKLRKSSKLHEGVKDPIAGTEGKTWLSGHRWEMTKAGTDADVLLLIKAPCEKRNIHSIVFR